MIFGVVPIMKKVGEKIVKEAPEDVIVLSHKFPIPEETGLRQIAIIDDIRIFARLSRSEEIKREMR